jgi:hypothetical protein
MLKKPVQQGRSEAHGATNKEHHVCARRRVGEAAVSWADALHSHPPNPELSEQLFSRVGYVEDLNDARTTLAVFFSILPQLLRLLFLLLLLQQSG